jgi:glutathione S-transferase
VEIIILIILYTHTMSPCAQKVRIVLAEKGLDWKAHPIDLQNKENLEPWYLSLNPLGVVPTLVHEDRAIIESSIICEYLEDVFPQVPLRPTSAYVMSKMRLWFKHIDNKLHPSCGALQWPLVMRSSLLKKSPEEQQQIIDKIPEAPRRERQRRLLAMGLEAPDIKGAVKIYHDTIEMMEEALQQEMWLTGKGFGLADCAMAPYFQTIDQFGWLEMLDAYPSTRNWYDRVCSRGSYQRAVADDFSPELLKKLKTIGAEAWPTIGQQFFGPNSKA